MLQPAQLDRVERAAQARLLLVTAPAGFGKTTLVVVAARTLGWRSAWYRLDSSDAHPENLLAGIAATLGNSLPGGDTTLLQDFHDFDPSELPMLVERLAAAIDALDAGPVYLVLDDCDAAGHDAAAAVVTLLVDRLPATVHLVAIGRGEMLFRNTRLGLTHRIEQLRCGDLRFDAGQTRSVFTALGHAGVGTREIETVLELTEGWPAGVVFLARALADRGPAAAVVDLGLPAARRDVFAYFGEEVFERVSPELRAFLDATCCLESITVPVAGAVSGSDRARYCLDTLVADGAFTFPDAECRSFRYHALFRDYLRERHRSQHGDGAYRDLVIRAAAAVEDADDVEQAIVMLMGVDEPGLALDVLVRAGQSDLGACRTQVLQRLALAVEGHRELSVGWTLLLQGLVAGREGHGERALANLIDAEARFAASGDEGGRRLALCELQLRHFYAGEHKASIAAASRALAVTNDESDRFMVLFHWAFALTFIGRWTEFEAILDQATRLASQPAAKARVLGLRTTAALLRGEFNAGRAVGLEALDLLEASAGAESVAGFTHMLALLTVHCGEYREAERLCARGLELCERYDLSYERATTFGATAMIEAAAGRLAEALTRWEKFLTVLMDPENDPESYANEQVHMGTALRRAGDLQLAAETYRAAAANLGDVEALFSRQTIAVDLGFTTGLAEGGLSERIAELERQRAQATACGFAFVAMKAEFFALSLARRGGLIADDTYAARLRDCIRRQIELGHVHFLCQELALDGRLRSELLRMDDPVITAGVLDAVARHWQAPRLLADAMRLSRETALAALEVGAGRLDDKGIAALVATAKGHSSPAVRRAAADLSRLRGLADSTTPPFPELTARESEVLALVAAGCRNQEIAERLVLSTATVKTHVHRILSKLEIGNRVQAGNVFRERT